MELVSAIITTYKRSPAIVRRAVLSVLHQTYRGIEIIVVDDSPPDYAEREGVRDLIQHMEKEFGVQIAYIAHEKNMGACAARNTGLSACHGTFVGFLDDDDEWLPEKVESMLPAFENHKVALVYCNCLNVNDDTGIKQEIKREKHEGKVFDQLIFSNFIGSTSFPLVRRDSILSVGAFDTRMQSAQDFDMWLRLAERYEVAYVDKANVVYHVHKGEQISKNINKRIAGLERTCEKNQAYLNKHPEAYWMRYMKLAYAIARKPDKKNALRIWAKCVAKCPGNIKGNFSYLAKILK